MKRPSGKRLVAIMSLGTLAFLLGNLYQPTVVVGQSMSPTLPDGQVIYIDRTYYQTHRPAEGEVVVFRHDGETYIKRIYRAPGGVVHYLADGPSVVSLVSPARAEEVRQRYGNRPNVLQVKTLQVPDDCVYVLGDNYFQSEDSRELGPIPISEIVGRAHLPVDATLALPHEFRPEPSPLRGIKHAQSAKASTS